jgi:hypothetical protein
MKALLFVALIAVPLPALAQTPQPEGAATPASISVGMHVGTQPGGYDDGGRRDPFVSLVVPKRATGPGAARVRSGLGGQALADVVVRGIMKAGTTRFAILETPGKKSFVAHVKDKLLDATVQSIDDAGVVFVEDDGMGAPGNQVRKALRAPGEDAGEDR